MISGVRRILVRLLLALACWAGAAVPAGAVGTPVATCVLPAAPGMEARDLFATPRRFDCATPQRAFGSGDFWVMSAPLPTVSSSFASVRFASTWFDRVTLYVRYADGAIRHTGFTSATAGRHLALGAMIAQQIPHHDAAAVRLLWHVEGAGNLRGVMMGVSVAGHGDSANAEIGMAMVYAAFAGMALALIVYNLALWGALRQAFQPAYCLLLLCLLAYAFTSSGLAGQWLPSLDNNDRQRLNSVFLSSSAAATLVFARTFFERRIFVGWLGRATIAVAVLVVAISGTYALVAPWQARTFDLVVTGSYLALMLLVPAILWHAWTRRSNYLWLFALAWGTPIALAGMRIANAFGALPYAFWLDQSTIISMALEAMLSSLAIAYRIRLLSRERDRAREREIEARLLAATDPLTGLLNRRAFLDQAIGRGGDQMLLLADIDHFKRVNETIGHDGGDEVLRLVARALRAAVPADALVARLGGEEFAILAPADSSLAAINVLERLRAERMPFDLTVTASIGTCTGPLTREVDWKALYRSADRALFDAKAAGRDRAKDGGTFARAA